MMKSKKSRGGYIAPYSSSPNSSEYMLNSTVNADAIANISYANNNAELPEIYIPPTASPVVANQNTPGIQGGSKSKKLTANDHLELNDGFLYSLDGGCACNAVTGGGKCKKGGDIVLTPFISALALLGARMLADKNSGFNLGELFGNNEADNNEDESESDSDDEAPQQKKKSTKGGSKCSTQQRYRRGAGSSCNRGYY